MIHCASGEAAVHIHIIQQSCCIQEWNLFAAMPFLEGIMINRKQLLNFIVPWNLSMATTHRCMHDKRPCPWSNAKRYGNFGREWVRNEPSSFWTKRSNFDRQNNLSYPVGILIKICPEAKIFAKKDYQDLSRTSQRNKYKTWQNHLDCLFFLSGIRCIAGFE